MNIGTGINTARLAFGPAVVFLGAAGATPTADIGLIGEDGVELELQSEMADIVQGNPAMSIKRYATMQAAFIRCQSIEWSPVRIAQALGTGTTSSSANNEIYNFGGDPCVDDVAVLLQHRKCVAAHTINVRMWKAAAETGGLSVAFSPERHQMGYAWKALRSATNWAGATLDDGGQLVQIDIQLQ